MSASVPLYVAQGCGLLRALLAFEGDSSGADFGLAASMILNVALSFLSW